MGILSGTYSSIFIASPVLTHWKERERTFRARVERIRGESGGVVPAYAGGAADVEPTAPDRATPRLTQPSKPGEISRSEFDELVRMQQGDGEGDVRRDPFGRPVVDGGDGDGVGTARRPSRTTSTRAAKPPKPKRPRNRRHGRNR